MVAKGACGRPNEDLIRSPTSLKMLEKAQGAHRKQYVADVEMKQVKLLSLGMLDDQGGMK